MEHKEGPVKEDSGPQLTLLRGAAFFWVLGGPGDLVTI